MATNLFRHCAYLRFPCAGPCCEDLVIWTKFDVSLSIHFPHATCKHTERLVKYVDVSSFRAQERTNWTLRNPYIDFFMHFVDDATTSYRHRKSRVSMKRVSSDFITSSDVFTPKAQSLVASCVDAELLAMLSHLSECLLFYLAKSLCFKSVNIREQCIMMTSYLPSPSAVVTYTRALNRQNF